MTYEHSPELYHYGVLGMKWGHRKASYSYTSSSTKRYQRKSDKFKAQGDSAKAKEYARYAKKSQELDNRISNNVKSYSRGKTAAKIFVNGLFASKTYEVAKAAGYNRVGSEVEAVVSSYLGGPFGNMAANSLIRREYVRN